MNVEQLMEGESAGEAEILGENFASAVVPS
jgi:hypothetical protein